jgi:hypothetical protein
MTRFRSWLCLFGAASLCVLAAASLVRAQGFAVQVSPPRFELAARPGERLREVVEITNAGRDTARLKLKTADWSLDLKGGVTFEETLQPGSCRPWVAIERREIAIAPGGAYRYRFEVLAPPATAPRECRFALLVEGDDTAVHTSGGLDFPVNGRIGVIVYVAFGAIEPSLEVVRVANEAASGERVPTIYVRNSGTAHGRLTGFLSGLDAAGKKLEFTPSSLPILPGETRAITLFANSSEGKAAQAALPITIRGTLEWGNRTLPFEQRFGP